MPATKEASSFDKLMGLFDDVHWPIFVILYAHYLVAHFVGGPTQKLSNNANTQRYNKKILKFWVVLIILIIQN